jgi:hypothetical protein
MKSRPIKLITAEILIVVAGVLFLTLPLPMLKGASQGRKQIEQSLRDAYQGKTLWLRNFYIGPTLKFDSKGGVVKGQEVGPWTLYCRILVDGIKLKSHTVEIRARRLFLHYLNQEKKFQELRDGGVLIRIDLGHKPSSAQDPESLLTKIFVRSGEDFSELVPPYWKEFCSHTHDPDWSQKQLEKHLVKGEMRDKAETFPVPIFEPEPPMTSEARAGNINGTVALLVGIDEYGRVSDIMLVTPLGMGGGREGCRNTQDLEI